MYVHHTTGLVTRAFASVLCGLALVGNAGDAGAAEMRLRFSGVIGQSQPAGTEPYPAIHCQGVAVDGSGRLWVAPGGPTVFILAPESSGSTTPPQAAESSGSGALPPAGPSRSGHFGKALGERWEVRDRVELPAPAASRTALRWDGRAIWAWCADHRLLTIDPATQNVTTVCRLPADTVQIEIASADSATGFAVTAKILVLSGNKVLGFSPDGGALGERLTVPAIPDAKYTGLGLEPGSGDLIVGSGYPDMKLYRYTSIGRQVTNNGWPRPGWPLQFITLDGLAWMLAPNGLLQSVPGLRRTNDEVQGFAPAWANYGAGLAPDGAGGWWIACSQGLVRFAADGTQQERLGGICGVRSLAIAADGTVMAAVENGQRMVRCGLDDEPATPLRGNANEPWRPAAGWKSRSAGLAADTTGFLVLDEVENRLWRFDPEHTAWSEKPWTPLTAAGTFNQPRALALGDALAWVLDGDRVLEAERSTWAFRAVVLPGIESPTLLTGLAAARDRRLIGSTARGIHVWQRTADAGFRTCWTLPSVFRRIAGVTANDDTVAVADPDAGTITLLSLADGRQIAASDGRSVPGGMKPEAMAFSGSWLLVADDAGKRLLRFRCERL